MALAARSLVTAHCRLGCRWRRLDSRRRRSRPVLVSRTIMVRFASCRATQHGPQSCAVSDRGFNVVALMAVGRDNDHLCYWRST